MSGLNQKEQFDEMVYRYSSTLQITKSSLNKLNDLIPTKSIRLNYLTNYQQNLDNLIDLHLLQQRTHNPTHLNSTDANRTKSRNSKTIPDKFESTAHTAKENHDYLNQVNVLLNKIECGLNMSALLPLTQAVRARENFLKLYSELLVQLNTPAPVIDLSLDKSSSSISSLGNSSSTSSIDGDSIIPSDPQKLHSSKSPVSITPSSSYRSSYLLPLLDKGEELLQNLKLEVNQLLQSLEQKSPGNTQAKSLLEPTSQLPTPLGRLYRRLVESLTPGSEPESPPKDDVPPKSRFDSSKTLLLLSERDQSRYSELLATLKKSTSSELANLLEEDFKNQENSFFEKLQSILNSCSKNLSSKDLLSSFLSNTPIIIRGVEISSPDNFLDFVKQTLILDKILTSQPYQKSLPLTPDEQILLKGLKTIEQLKKFEELKKFEQLQINQILQQDLFKKFKDDIAISYPEIYTNFLKETKKLMVTQSEIVAQIASLPKTQYSDFKERLSALKAQLHGPTVEAEKFSPILPGLNLLRCIPQQYQEDYKELIDKLKLKINLLSQYKDPQYLQDSIEKAENVFKKNIEAMLYKQPELIKLFEPIKTDPLSWFAYSSKEPISINNQTIKPEFYYFDDFLKQIAISLPEKEKKILNQQYLTLFEDFMKTLKKINHDLTTKKFIIQEIDAIEQKLLQPHRTNQPPTSHQPMPSLDKAHEKHAISSGDLRPSRDSSLTTPPKIKDN